jgi:hypothetical protein
VGNCLQHSNPSSWLQQSLLFVTPLGVATVLGSWAKIPGLMKDDEIVKHIKDKQFHWGNDSGETDIMEID